MRKKRGRKPVIDRPTNPPTEDRSDSAAVSEEQKKLLKQLIAVMCAEEGVEVYFMHPVDAKYVSPAARFTSPLRVSFIRMVLSVINNCDCHDDVTGLTLNTMSISSDPWTSQP